MRFAQLYILLPCLALAGGPQVGSGAETVRDAKLHISFVVPEGFVPAPPEIRQPEFPHIFVMDWDQPAKAIFIKIRGSGGKRLEANELSAGELASLRQRLPGAERFTEEWKSIPMDGIKAVVTNPDGVRQVHYALPLSTEPEATLIWVSGPVEREPEVHGYLQTVLRTFEGTPSSLPQPSDRFVPRNKHLVLAALILLLLVGLGWRAMRRKRFPPATKTD